MHTQTVKMAAGDGIKWRRKFGILKKDGLGGKAKPPLTILHYMELIHAVIPSGASVPSRLAQVSFLACYFHLHIPSFGKDVVYYFYLHVLKDSQDG